MCLGVYLAGSRQACMTLNITFQYLGLDISKCESAGCARIVRLYNYSNRCASGVVLAIQTSQPILSFKASGCKQTVCLLLNRYAKRILFQPVLISFSL